MNRISLTQAAREVLDGPHTRCSPRPTPTAGRSRPSSSARSRAGRYVEIRGSGEIAADPEKALLRETPPPEPGAARLIVRIVPEKEYLWPPAA
ncbi:hypothetical protein ACGFMK_38920 [Amycolatopsis sp. NPDC049252]|uniref:hypothetical protein n=1 Tax=Amycolatopsis sp. NPDC049252 TaxID=3363933 RepID=UPI003718CC3F